MNFKDLHQQKLNEITMALHAAGLPVCNENVRRVAWLMNFHLTNHQLRLTAKAGVELLKLEIAEFIVHKHGAGHYHTTVPASFN